MASSFLSSKFLVAPVIDNCVVWLYLGWDRLGEQPHTRALSTLLCYVRQIAPVLISSLMSFASPGHRRAYGIDSFRNTEFAFNGRGRDCLSGASRTQQSNSLKSITVSAIRSGRFKSNYLFVPKPLICRHAMQLKAKRKRSPPLVALSFV